MANLLTMTGVGGPSAGTHQGAITSSTLGAPGILFAPGDTAYLPTSSSPPVAAVVVVDTVTQSDAITAVTITSITVLGDRRATYPDGSSIRIYGEIPGGD